MKQNTTAAECVALDSTDPATGELAERERVERAVETCIAFRRLMREAETAGHDLAEADLDVLWNTAGQGIAAMSASISSASGARS